MKKEIVLLIIAVILFVILCIIILNLEKIFPLPPVQEFIRK